MTDPKHLERARALLSSVDVDRNGYVALVPETLAAAFAELERETLSMAADECVKENEEWSSRPVMLCVRRLRALVTR